VHARVRRPCSRAARKVSILCKARCVEDSELPCVTVDNARG
jgi:hypothetical protein